MKLRVMTIAGTRPELIRLSECIKKLDALFDHQMAHTGQNYDPALSDVFFNELGIRQPDHYLGVGGGPLGQAIGAVIARSYDLLAAERPDALLILGDTNSALCALSAKRLKIPVFHMEAGNRCFDENVPEEINRRMIDHIADVNLPYTERARRNLLAEGISRFVFVTGSPLFEVLERHKPSIESSKALENLGLQPGGYFTVSAHREENIDDPGKFARLMNALNSVAAQYGLPLIYSVHPRSRDYIQKRGFEFHPLVRLAEPFGLFDYIRLQRSSFCALSDSGTLAEEANILGFPAVLLRTSTERQEVMEYGGMVLGGVDAADVANAIETARALRGQSQPVPEYAMNALSDRIAAIIQSYTHIVNREVWRKC